MIYLDHAATSFPKPAAVLDAVRHWFEDLGVSADRGDSRRCAEVARGVRAARRGLARLTGFPEHRIAFGSGATELGNLFLRAFLRPGDRVLTTAFEHSSIARPLVALRRSLGLQISILRPDERGRIGSDAVRDALRATRPRLFAVTHASNVTGAVLDAAAFAALAREAGAVLLLDASQTAGLLDLDVGADAMIASCHKALLAPPGLGFLAAREGLDLEPQKQGGTGGSRALEEHPREWPLAFEAGTPNTPAILGLGAALRFLEQDPPRARLERSLTALDELALPLRANSRVRVFCCESQRVPVLSFVRDDLDPAEIGALCDAAGVHVRSGFHCAPWIHEYLGTRATGTVRISPGPDLSAADIRRAADVLAT
ncbi:MAG: aminotransferase class V-fold PLP-dependent enzyme [Planctomycetota bacterium]